MNRDPHLEQTLLLAAVPAEHRFAGAELVGFAQKRAHAGPVILEDDRDLVEDLREELADAGNYAAWGAMADQLTPGQAAALGYHLAAAWDIVRHLDRDPN